MRRAGFGCVLKRQGIGRKNGGGDTRFVTYLIKVLLEYCCTLSAQIVQGISRRYEW